MTDDAALARAHDIFDPIAVILLERDDVDIGPMFGREGIRIRGKVFAFVAQRGALVVKLPAERIDALVEFGHAERMTMGGRSMREWAIVEPDAAQHWAALMEDALTFVDSITP